MPPSLTAAIEALHQALVDLTDPQDVSQATQCLNILTTIQQRLMSQQGGPGGQAAGPPGGGPPPGSPQQALLAQLQG